MAHEIMQETYAWAPGGAGAVGYLSPDKKAVCGGIYHVDEKLNPLWVNGGIVKNKHHVKLLS